MLSNTYAELITDVKDYIDREDIPDTVFKRSVSHAESKVNEVLKTPAQEVIAEGTTDADGKISVPSNFLFMKRISIIKSGREFPLRRTSYKEYNSIKDDSGYNVPQVFYRENGDFYVAPRGVFDVRIVFYQEVPSIISNLGTNWLIQLSPDLYFSAAMSGAYEYIMDEEKAMYWNEKFKKAIGRVQSLADRTEWEGSHMIVGSPQ